VHALEINSISKRFGQLQAVQDFSLELAAGEVYGLLGPNGSGKTTTLGIILGIIKADSGSYRWFNEKPSARLRKRIGTLLETPNFYGYMTAMENLKIVAHIRGLNSPNYEDVLKRVGLWDRRLSKFKTYSLGMKQRLGIGAALLGDPEVLIFDEPTNGLDPQGIIEVRELILSIAGEGRTILMASHILNEVERICSHVAIIKKGHLLRTGPVGAVLGSNRYLDVAAEDMEALKALLLNTNGIVSITKGAQNFEVEVSDDITAAGFNSIAFNKGINLTHLVLRKRSLESEFLEITKDV